MGRPQTTTPQAVQQHTESLLAQLTTAQRAWAEGVARTLAAARTPLTLLQLRAHAGTIPGGPPGGSIELAMIAIVGSMVGITARGTARGGPSGSSHSTPDLDLSVEARILMTLLETMREVEASQRDALKQVARGG